jgi:hypothetical protein
LPEELLGVVFVVPAVKEGPKMGRKEVRKATGFWRKLKGSDLETFFSALFNPGAKRKNKKTTRTEPPIKPLVFILTSLQKLVAWTNEEKNPL